MDVSSQMKLPNNHGIMDESDSSSSISLSSVSDFMEDSASCTSSESSSSSEADGPLYAMDSLKASLPFKRGLSKFFGGKSQSFTSLADVKCLEDLAKPENPYRKKMKSFHSYGSRLDCHRSYPPSNSCGCISKKPHKGNSLSAMAKKGSFLPTGPPPVTFTRICNVEEASICKAENGEGI